MKLDKKYIDRFWSKVDKSGDCWEWAGAKNHNGYGRFHLPVKQCRAHRFSYILTHGHIPPGMCVCHTCDNPGCVNPDHLWLGTIADNMKDKERKGRSMHPRGESLPQSKLTEKQVLEIRAKYIPFKYSLSRLAREYNINNVTVHDIITRRRWKHI